MNNTHLFQPKPNAVTLALWQFLGRLTAPTLSTTGINWRAYVRSGGPARFIGRRG